MHVNCTDFFRLPEIVKYIGSSFAPANLSAITFLYNQFRQENNITKLQIEKIHNLYILLLYLL